MKNPIGNPFNCIFDPSFSIEKWSPNRLAGQTLLDPPQLIETPCFQLKSGYPPIRTPPPVRPARSGPPPFGSRGSSFGLGPKTPKKVPVWAHVFGPPQRFGGSPPENSVFGGSDLPTGRPGRSGRSGPGQAGQGGVDFRPFWLARSLREPKWSKTGGRLKNPVF